MSEDDRDPNAPRPLPSLDGGPPRPPKVTIRDLEDDFNPGESILDEIARRMRRFPWARVVRRDNSIAYIPDEAEGFIVKLTEVRGFPSYFVAYDKCVGAFDTRSFAVTQFGFGLSTACRLREHLRGGRVFRQSVEVQLRSSSSWRLDSAAQFWTGWTWHLFAANRFRYRQNHLIDLDAPAASCAA